MRRTKESILKEMLAEMPFEFNPHCKPYILEAMQIYSDYNVKLASDGVSAGVVGQSCDCGNKLTDKELYFGQCLQCDKNVEEAN